MTTVGVLGPGGVGGVVAARLARAGHDVSVVAGERTAAAIAAGGLHYTGPDGTWEGSVEARSLLVEPVDVLVIATKAMDLPGALQRVPGALVRDTVVAPLLNGIDHVAYLRAELPGVEVIASSISVEATRHRPGVVEQVSGFCDVGVSLASEGGRRWAELAEQAGCSVSTAPDDASVLWRKLSFLAPLALLTTSAEAPIGTAIQRQPDLVRPIVAEAVAAAAAAGVPIDADGIEGRLRSLPEGMQSSMLKDHLGGRSVELDAIAGPIIRALGRDGAHATVTAALRILGSAR
ncbi:2-dehydropantoate 2-reductase [Intrasporangium sp. DVR]|uniref:ketopantoate reductase family protein n=1 Tax=Intrasporangium sp. DVR TaxID=3127867 RepID=UPI00313A64FD